MLHGLFNRAQLCWKRTPARSSATTQSRQVVTAAARTSTASSGAQRGQAIDQVVSLQWHSFFLMHFVFLNRERDPYSPPRSAAARCALSCGTRATCTAHSPWRGGGGGGPPQTRARPPPGPPCNPPPTTQNAVTAHSVQPLLRPRFYALTKHVCEQTKQHT
jgi:hypothetical protein